MDADEISLDDGAEEQSPAVKPLRDPSAPTQAQIDKYNLTHLPFQDMVPSVQRENRNLSCSQEAWDQIEFLD